MTTNTILRDQKKCTSDALQRRFALAEAELHAQQRKNEKRPLEENKGVSLDMISSSADVTDALLMPSSNALSKKGNFSFSGHARTQDMEANDATYFGLSHPVHENLLPTSHKISDRTGNTVKRVLHDLLQSGDSAQKYLQGSRSMNIYDLIHLDNHVQGRNRSLGARVRALQAHSKRSKKHMSMKQHRECGSLDLPQEFYKKNQVAQHLLTADLHGAMILVVQCRMASFTGVIGIMIRETTETFGIITQDNKFQVVPKKLSVFMIQVDCWKITLRGDKLTSRNVGS